MILDCCNERNVARRGRRSLLVWRYLQSREIFLLSLEVVSIALVVVCTESLVFLASLKFAAIAFLTK